MPPQQKISFVIPTLREEEYLERTLAALSQMKIPHEIIVTDGGSTDKTLDIARRYTQKIVVWDKPRRQTFGEAKNAGAALAAGEFLVFIDADVLIPNAQEFFEEMLSLFEKDPKLVGATVPMRVIPEFARGLDKLFGEPLNLWYRFENNVLHRGNASGEFQMMRTESFRTIGGYNEKLAAGEDNEMFRHLRTLGRTTYHPKYAIYHTFRRPHKLGWLKLYYIWLKNGFSVMFRNRAAYKEWEVIR